MVCFLMGKNESETAILRTVRNAIYTPLLLVWLLMQNNFYLQFKRHLALHTKTNY